MSNRSKSRTKNTSLIHNEVKLIHHSKKKVSRLSLLNDLLLSSEFFRQYSKRKAKTPHKNNTTRNKKLPISITSKGNSTKPPNTTKHSDDCNLLHQIHKRQIKHHKATSLIKAKGNSKKHQKALILREMNTSPMYRNKKDSYNKNKFINARTYNISLNSLKRNISTKTLNKKPRRTTKDSRKVSPKNKSEIIEPKIKKEIIRSENEIKALAEGLKSKKLIKSSSAPNFPKTNKIEKTIYKIETLSQVGYNGPGIEKFNQDNYFIFKNLNDEKGTLYMGVCDGHGIVGHDVSGYLIHNLPKNIHNELLKSNKYLKNKDNLNKILTNVFRSTNKSLCNTYSIDTKFSGSTCVTLILTKNKIISANAGDSRAVMGRFKDGKWLSVDLSRDHKPNDEGEKKRILSHGGRIDSYKDENGGDLGPQRVWLQNEDIPGLAMSRSFGDEVAASVGTICDPEIKYFDLTEEDKFIIIASDGIWEFISSQECVEIIKDYYISKDLNGCLKHLFLESSKRWIKEEEVIDDITVILIFFEE